MSLIKTIEPVVSTWPQLRHLLNPLDEYISCLEDLPNTDGHKSIIRFTNNYGLEVSKYPHWDFFEITVIRFSGQGTGDYEFVFDIPHIPDLTMAYTDKDILRLCEQVSLLR